MLSSAGGGGRHSLIYLYSSFVSCSRAPTVHKRAKDILSGILKLYDLPKNLPNRLFLGVGAGGSTALAFFASLAFSSTIAFSARTSSSDRFLLSELVASSASVFSGVGSGCSSTATSFSLPLPFATGASDSLFLVGRFLVGDDLTSSSSDDSALGSKSSASTARFRFGPRLDGLPLEAGLDADEGLDDDCFGWVGGV